MAKSAEPKKIRIAKRIGTVGALVLGLSIYALLADDPGAIYPELADRQVVILMMICSVLCIAAEQFIKIPYYREKKRQPEAQTAQDNTATNHQIKNERSD